MVSAKDRELEETEERHQMEVKIYKQKVKHLLYEQENHLAGLKAENMVRISCSKLCYFLGVDIDCWKDSVLFSQNNQVFYSGSF